ncbi:MAG TPA: TldD/PmbA family protein [Vicinamibacterales bacterium]|nr:TldD/PmbA family protein [Vicinamibacterales bacterium]
MSAQTASRAVTPSGMQILSREQAKALADRVLALSAADQTRVNIVSGWSGSTRFADGSISTSGGVNNTSLTVTVTVGRRQASASTNVLEEASLKRTVDLAAQLARLSPEDPDLMPELGPQSYSAVNAYVGLTADLDAEARAAAVARGVRAATAAGKAAGEIFTAGFLEANAQVVAVATSKGLFAYHRTTDANFSVTARTPDGTGSGWASGGAHDWAAVDTARIGRVAAQKAVASRNPQTIEPGMYTAVLEPQAVTDLIPLLAGALSARNADEGRSPFSKPGGGTRIGEKVADERVTLYSDPADPALQGLPFDQQGLPVKRVVWIEKGILKNLVYSRFWAQKQGTQPTGGALVGGLALTGGTKSTEELIAGCARGILVTHFFYIRSLDPRTVLQTGLTRDGAFLIEQGKITRALKNFRWNESPLLMLSRLEDLGRPEPTAAGRLMPALRVRGFNFTSLSDAV